MPFGTTNAPGFYSAMTKNFKYEWDIIFIETFIKIGTLFSEKLQLQEQMKSSLKTKI